MSESLAFGLLKRSYEMSAVDKSAIEKSVDGQ
jgi:hypothetical protein